MVVVVVVVVVMVVVVLAGRWTWTVCNRRLLLETVTLISSFTNCD